MKLCSSIKHYTTSSQRSGSGVASGNIQFGNYKMFHKVKEYIFGLQNQQ